ncbi:MAG: N-acetylgalactosamine-6-sulfatase [Opitutus sp.]|nr:N-acetylgalactosamine-6-sulfatase [Opitutus sp.]
MNRLLVITAAAWALGAGAGATAAPSPRPNIVVILADDLGYGDLGCYGHPRIKTPHLDRLAAEGTRFMQFYVPHSVCSPTRAAAVTGQYPSRWHTYAHFAWLSDNARRGMPDWLDVTAPSLPRALQQVDYRTALFGKWHLGGGSGRNFGGKAINSADAPPVTAYGFDEVRTVVGNGPTWLGLSPVEAPHDTYPYDDKAWGTESSRCIADSSIDFIERHVRDRAGRPFWLNVWLHNPHVPLLPTDEMRKPYADIGDRGTQAYYAVVTEMDRQIGRLLARLDELGLRENTLVLFTSDNGAPSREGSLDSGRAINLAVDTAGNNGPLRGWKWHLHEGGIRVPFIVRWPGHVPAGRTDTASILNLCDFAPTFTRLAGASMPAGHRPDGVDMSDALFGRPFDRGQPMFWHNPTANRRGPQLAVREGPWKLLLEPDGTLVELYNLEQDIAESANVAGKNPGIVNRLSSLLRAWHRSLPPPLDRPVWPEGQRR